MSTFPSLADKAEASYNPTSTVEVVLSASRDAVIAVPAGSGLARGDCLSNPAPRRLRRADHRGRIAVQRRPLKPKLGLAGFVCEVAITPIPGDPPAMPWAAAVSSLLGGIVISFLFSPLFMILAGVSFLGLLGRAVFGRVSARRKRKRRAKELAAARIEIAAELEQWTKREQQRQSKAVTSVIELAEQLQKGSMPWSSRLGQGEPLGLLVGVGEGLASPVHINLGPSSGGPDNSEQSAFQIDPQGGGVAAAGSATFQGDSELRGLVPPVIGLSEVPIVVSVEASSGLALVGDRRQVLDAARAAVASCSLSYGPADLGLIVVTTADRLSDWDWIKWLPATQAVAVTPAEVEEALGSLVERNHSTLVVLDGVEAVVPGALANLLGAKNPLAHVLWLGATQDVPAVCSSVATVTADGLIVVEDFFGRSTLRGRSYGCDGPTARQLALLLAPFEDPLLGDWGTGSHLPSSVALTGLLDLEDDPSGAIGERWSRSEPHKLSATLGVDINGPVRVDLVADGPHTLIAGTTGSGKSELLRTLVMGLALDQPPEAVSFVLIDFKGGGAFDAVAGFPHVAAVVTDLDAADASRALQSLRAELREREERLRELEVSDLSDAAGAMPRLVIAVDEFAALADELPEFLDGLVDVARRGRSLGVHLVLATQRPAGVVTGQIRANTNLRICLRVQDRSDSLDVIDSPDAAALPPVPGRAIMSFSGETRSLQIASISGVGAQGAGYEPFVVHPMLLGSLPPLAGLVDLASLPGLSVGPAQAAPVSASASDCTAACDALSSYRPDAPWLEPISDVDLVEVATELNSVSNTADGRRAESQMVGLGWLDDPDHRRRLAYGWDCVSDGLLIVGADVDEVEHTVKAAVAGFSELGVVPDVYVLDGRGSGLASLAELPYVADVIPVVDAERCVKAIEQIAKVVAKGADHPTALVVHRWSVIADALTDAGGFDGPTQLERLVREGMDRGLRLIVTGGNDRDVPGRVSSRLRARVIHGLADPAAYLSFDLRPKTLPKFGPRVFIDPVSGLAGLLGVVGPEKFQELTNQPLGRPRPEPVRILGAVVESGELPAAVALEDELKVPIGLTENLEPCWLALKAGQHVVVLGQEGSSRGAVAEAVAAALALAETKAGPGPCFDDGEIAAEPVRVRFVPDGDRLSQADGAELIAEANNDGTCLIIEAAPASARGFNSWLAPLITDSTVVLVNPSRGEAELCRVVVPDMVDSPAGRAIVVSRGRAQVVQLVAGEAKLAA